MERRLEAAGRRTYTLQTFWQCVRAPRRESMRRQGDRPYTVTDRVEPMVGGLAIALMVFSLLDSVFTLTLISNGGKELNPVMDMMLQHSISLFAGSKMFMTALAAIVLSATANVLVFRRFRARSVLAAAVGMYAALIGYELLLLNHMRLFMQA